MAVDGFNEDQFKRILRENFQPARAISNPTQLKGRDKLLRQIDRAFNSAGKHVFIYGDRGVGKTSLAQSAAVLHQSSDMSPTLIACDQYVDFYKIVEDIASGCANSSTGQVTPASRKTTVQVPGFFQHEHTHKHQESFQPNVRSLNDAINLLKYVSTTSRSPVIIIDEFDQLGSTDDKKRFADLIKQVSDQEINIRFIFCGIGSSLDELIGTHLSTDRYILPLALDPISYDARWEILENVEKALNIEIGREEKVRIALISDGFPYYVHLVGEHLFWAIYDDPEIVRKVGISHFDTAVKGAIQEAVGSLKQAYKLATQKPSNDYREALWSVADTTMFERKNSEIYERSYLEIASKLNKENPLSREKFFRRLSKLKSAAHGHILQNTEHRGWTVFSENWMRGYVRLQAENSGINLGVDHHLAAKSLIKRY